MLEITQAMCQNNAINPVGVGIRNKAENPMDKIKNYLKIGFIPLHLWKTFCAPIKGMLEIWISL